MECGAGRIGKMDVNPYEAQREIQVARPTHAAFADPTLNPVVGLGLGVAGFAAFAYVGATTAHGPIRSYSEMQTAATFASALLTTTGVWLLWRSVAV